MLTLRRRWSKLSASERQRRARRLRLLWACQGDEDEADAVERLLQHGLRRR